LEISNASLVRSREGLAEQIAALNGSLSVAETESQVFQTVLDAFRELRSEFGLPLDGSPRNIRNVITGLSNDKLTQSD
jgi:hypothetical protein